MEIMTNDENFVLANQALTAFYFGGKPVKPRKVCVGTDGQSRRVRRCVRTKNIYSQNQLSIKK